MVLIQKREWTLRSGEIWTSWAVRWLDADGREQMKPFTSWPEAETFFDIKLAEREASRVHEVASCPANDTVPLAESERPATPLTHAGGAR